MKKQNFNKSIIKNCDVSKVFFFQLNLQIMISQKTNIKAKTIKANSKMQKK